MVSRRTLNTRNLEALGARRLAQLLIEIVAGNTAAKRRLRLELAGAESPAAAAREVRKRLAAIRRSHAFLDSRKRRDLVDDLETQRKAIVHKVAKADAAEALDLMWQLTGLANAVFERCYDNGGMVAGVFQAAVSDLGGIASAARADPRGLADRVFEAMTENRYGQYGNLIGVLAPTLGQEGLEHLKQRMIEFSNAPVAPSAGEHRSRAERRFQVTTGEPKSAGRVRRGTARRVLRDIADAQGDVDAFIVQHDEDARKAPEVAAGIARRLLVAGRAEEALKAVDAAVHRALGDPNRCYFHWEDARIDALEALGRADEAQQVRWQCFERSLSEPHLRAYLKRLPDFDDIEAEEKALDHALEFRDLLTALSFLVSWPALDKASTLAIHRAEDFDGDHYGILMTAADALADRHPLAATLLLRAMIDFTLAWGKATRYKHAARHLLECSSLSPAIPDFGTFETHEAYETRLRREHARKQSFWNSVSDVSTYGAC